MARHATVLAVSLTLAACRATGDAGRIAVERWAIDPTPSVDIGVEMGDEHYELQQAGSALRLPDGRIVVGNSGSRELRFYDSTGHYLYARGGRGRVPVSSPGGSSSTKWHPIPSRSSIEAPTTCRRSTDPECSSTAVFSNPGPVTSPSWAPGSTGGTGSARLCDSTLRTPIDQALDQMGDPPAGEYRYAMRADDGALWTHLRPLAPGSDTVSWEIHAADGRLVALLDLPAGSSCTRQHRRSSWAAVGAPATRSTSGSIRSGRPERRWPLGRPLRPAPRKRREPSPSTRMKKALVGMVMAQEMYYADHSGYAQRPEALKTGRWAPPEGVTIDLLEGDKRGWLAIMADPGIGAICGMAVGSSTPPGWPEGAPVCSEP